MSTLFQDLRYAVRAFLRTPGFTAVIVLSIALGIAANTTIFSVINGLVIGALPVKQPDRLVSFNDGNSMSRPDYIDYRDQTGGVFEGVAAYFPMIPASVGGNGQPERIWGQSATANYFQVAGVQPALGRGFLPTEDQADGREAVVVLSHSLWQRRFGGEPSILGRQILLNGASYAVIGVAPAGFHGTVKMIVSEFWVPLSMSKSIMPDLARDGNIEKRDSQWLIVDARLAAGVTRQQAEATANVVKRRIDDAYFKTDENRRRGTIVLNPAGRLPNIGNMYGLMAVLMVVVGLVLVIACANVANLMLARGAARRREIAVRLAIGAPRSRLLRQLLTESMFLAVLGAAAGFVIAWFAAAALSRFELPISFPILFDFTPDWRVFLFTAALSVLTGLLFGLAPALRATGTDLNSSLRGESGALAGFRRFGLRNALVVVQVSLSLLLLVGAGLFVRSLQNASSIDLGMKTENILLMAINPKLHGYTPDKTRRLLEQLRERVTALPGVRSVSYLDSIPLSIGGTTMDTSAADAKGGKVNASTDIYNVGANYFETVGTPVLRGREFARSGDKAAVIVNEKLAHALFGGADPIGQTLKLNDKDAFQVIAIVKNAKSRTLGEEQHPCAYFSLEERTADVMSFFGISILIKTAGTPAGYSRPVREQIAALDSSLAITGVETMQEHVDKALLLPRVCATLLGVFGLVGLALATIGLYGVLSFLVRTRTREIGIRMALGADRNGVLGMVARQGVALTGIGAGIGLLIAFGLSRFAASFLYGISALDPVTFLGVPVVLLAVSIVAILIPARRAALIQPTEALRCE